MIKLVFLIIVDLFKINLLILSKTYRSEFGLISEGM